MSRIGSPLSISYELLIALRYLKAKRRQAFISLISLLSVAGVAVGVMALVVVIAVMTGAEKDFKARILGFQSHITVMKRGGGIADPANLLDVIQGVDGVTVAAPFVYGQVMLRSGYGVSGAVVRGVDPAAGVTQVEGFDPDRLKDKLARKAPSRGRPPAPGVVLGKELALNLGVGEGDMIYLISPKGMISPMGHVPSMRRFRVAGLFDSGMYEYDSAFAYIHIEDAKSVFRLGDKVTGMDVWIDAPYEAHEVREGILGQLGPVYWARDWMQMNASLFSALKLEKAAMFVILILIVLVAAFNIASSLIMMVMEKTRDIAILKAMGATDGSIMRIFVYQGTLIGMVGTSIGVALGVALCFVLKHFKFIDLPKVYIFSTLPVRLEAMDVLAISASAFGICFLATLYPAWQASRQNTVEAIRYG
ncbi:lipoprotein-releasing ABC transporter permease subunit [Desulfoluna butyratoxydans]|uniref:Lipoprotein-releasing system transmembrane protein lolc/e n=1 Tax=Desulfoluna butyratoxydans TaxID=231438 RepID=A0A4U8YY25_9BACT|nr:lipoprotein-releasing ABC transporter permease subunit [Desulfoluna butyratoxydans]VFQ46992.1 lipoprotein-releasing system transmembrane protein lolc/e [Desulfoluna butyratoxydans]